MRLSGEIVAPFHYWTALRVHHMGVDTVVRSNVYRAVGSCVVCAGLMMGTGTAVSAAEPDTGGPGQSQSSGAGPGPQHRSKAAPGENPAIRAAEILRKTISDVTSVFGSGRLPGQQPPKTPEPAKVDTPVTASSENNDAGVASAASADTPSEGTSDTVSPTPSITTPVTNTDPPAVDPATPVVTEAVPPVVDPAPVPAAPLPAPVPLPVPVAISWPTNPVIDVISSVQYMVTSVVYTLTPIANDLSSLLGVAQWSPAVNTIRSDGPAPVPGTAVPLSAASSVLSPLPEIPAEALAGLRMSNETEIATVGTAATTRAGELETAPVEPLPSIAAIPMSVKEFFGNAVREVLRSPSLSALAALALPGVLGLFVITGAGIRFGYRQAKAALSLPASGLARFAPPQPLRLVRSRSVAISAPAVRFVPRELRGIGTPLENAA